jgi:hypothetical protein
MLLLMLAVLQTGDTVHVEKAATQLTFDGIVSESEYGAPTITMPRPGGAVQLWLKRSEGQVYIAAAIADSTYYWGDDLVIGLDTGGDRGDGPGHDDFQWYFRRMIDSSIVRRGEAGKWRMPRDDPDWKLGAERTGGGWEVRSANDARGWSIEFKLDPYYFQQAGRGTPAIAFRVYDDSPHGWTAWPSPDGVKRPTEVEDRPRLWVPILPTP